MAKLYIREFKAAGMVSGQLPIADTRDSLDQAPVTIQATSTQSAAFADTTLFIRVETDAICSIAFGVDSGQTYANPVATTNNMRLGVDGVEYFAVRSGDKLAVIANT